MVRGEMTTEDSRAQHEIAREIGDIEAQSAEHLATIELLEQQWDEYRQVMRANTRIYEEAGVGLGERNYFVQKGLAARRELDAFVNRLEDQHGQFLAETAREIRSTSEEKLERLRHEKAGASWG